MNGRCKQNAEQLFSNSENEQEAFEVFIKAMTQIIEKYGKIVLHELDYAA